MQGENFPDPEKKAMLDDNARKFLVAGLASDFLTENGATSFALITDWLQTGESSEKKLAYKKFENGDVQTLLITKTTRGGSRTAVKEELTREQYEELLDLSILRVEKTRYEFNYMQDNILFSMKYDEFTEGSLRVLEVDASTDGERNMFDSTRFPAEVAEVTGDTRYYGYHVVEAIED